MEIKVSPTSKRLSLWHNFSWSVTGSSVYAGCQWGILVLLAKLTTSEMVGQFSLGLAITAPIIIFSQLHLRAVQATDAKYEYEFGHYIALRLMTTMLALILIACVVIWGGYSHFTALIILVLGIFKAFESMSDVLYGFIQKHERMDYIARSLVLHGISSIIVVGCVVLFTHNVLAGVVALATTRGLVLFTYDLYNVKVMLNDNLNDPTSTWGKCFNIKPTFRVRKLKALIQLTLPLAFVMTMISLKTNIPRLFIDDYCGARELGIYTALAYLVVVGNTIVSSIGQSCVPRMAKYYATGELNKYNSLLFRIVSLGAIIGCGGMLVAFFFGPSLLAAIYRPEYGQYPDLLVILFSAGALSYINSLLGYGLTATRNFKIFLLPYIIITAMAFTLSVLVIPSYGLKGAAWADLFLNLINLVMFIILLHKNTWRERAKSTAKDIV
ncbi:lipopolysaccharide biosynthesis protein [Desulforhopalus sp. IMCC35007]|uniref:lipopolysaccharide biosynthesis protein n=1 Tax=Desulforhopalus sp. IMCC35007 TaxID=2569543 RepID=UPI00145E4BF2|nr:oligosaccharide flippase family protein [Desulforhopalus sp. IMCC35007]